MSFVLQAISCPACAKKQKQNNNNKKAQVHLSPCHTLTKRAAVTKLSRKKLLTARLSSFVYVTVY